MHAIKYFIFWVALQFYFTSLFSQPVFKPFPQHTVYAKGTIKPNNVTQKQMDDTVRSFYRFWKERYINDDAGDGQYYVWVEGTVGNKQCVSEGQGYGMIIVALMAGYDSSAQKTFDGLFQYYRAHPGKNNPYLMAWAQTKKFRDIDGSSATDGDMDIAYSLLLADAQWGSKGSINYYHEAKEIISAISKQEINSKTFSILLSDAVDTDSNDYFDMRSSDFMPAHFRAFAKVSKDAIWNKVIDNNYKLFSFLQKKYSPEAGLLPDFIEHINDTPVPAHAMYLESRYDGYYNYNACRVPWRIATDYILYGDRRSKVMVQKINKWIYKTTQGIPDNISAGYKLEGDDIRSRHFEAMSFIAPFGVSAMVDKKNQAWLNKLWDYIIVLI